MQWSNWSRLPKLGSNDEIGKVIGQALTLAGDQAPVIVDVNIDYSKRTRFTQGGGQGGHGPAAPGAPGRKSAVHWTGVVAQSDRIDRTKKSYRLLPEVNSMP
jgi:hypothetical protein